jgi:hypothetical protein
MSSHPAHQDPAEQLIGKSAQVARLWPPGHRWEAGRPGGAPSSARAVVAARAWVRAVLHSLLSQQLDQANQQIPAAFSDFPVAFSGGHRKF